LADFGFCGVRDPPFTTEFSIAAHCAKPARVPLRSNPRDAGADHGCTGGIVPVRMGMQEAPSLAPAKVATMTSRTTQTVVHFSAPFRLPDFDTLQPAGDYRVDHDEEAIEGASWLAWRRVAAFIHLPAIGMRGPTQQMVPINPADLDAALEKDNQP